MQKRFQNCLCTIFFKSLQAYNLKTLDRKLKLFGEERGKEKQVIVAAI